MASDSENGVSDRLMNELESGDEVPIPGRKNPVEVSDMERPFGGEDLLYIYAEGSRGGEYRVCVDNRRHPMVEARPYGAKNRGRTGTPVSVEEWLRELHTDSQPPDR